MSIVKHIAILFGTKVTQAVSVVLDLQSSLQSTLLVLFCQTVLPTCVLPLIVLYFFLGLSCDFAPSEQPMWAELHL